MIQMYPPFNFTHCHMPGWWKLLTYLTLLDQFHFQHEYLHHRNLTHSNLLYRVILFHHPCFVIDLQ